MPNNVYIHIPFCKSKCRYCSFVSYPKLDVKTQYLSALQCEIKNLYKNEPLDTLYFGGGTPSLLTPTEFSEIIQLFKINPKTEITAELNPEQITKNYLIELKKTGINRLSFGCQTFNDEILKLIGRQHLSADVKNSVKLAQNIGFKNINLDFIYGLPNQTKDIFKNDLKIATNLNIQHISLYGLKLDEDCYFYKNPPKMLPDEDSQAEMYLEAIEFLTNEKFEHYEISNFSKNGYSSRHNLNYWNNNHYYGFGVAAHGYQDNMRYFNTSDLQEYMNNPISYKGSQELSFQEKLEEEIFLGLRKMEGINVKKINHKFNINFHKKYEKVLNKYISLKYLSETNTGFKLTVEGILISNIILSEFLE